MVKIRQPQRAMHVVEDQGGRSSAWTKPTTYANGLRGFFALAIRLRESRGASITADDVEQMAHELLARAETIEGGCG